MLGEERLGRLALEQVFGWAHAWLAYYAFTSEVEFWRGREGTVGISARALLVGLGSSCATLAYLYDNRSGARPAARRLVRSWTVRAHMLPVMMCSALDRLLSALQLPLWPADHERASLWCLLSACPCSPACLPVPCH